MSHYDILLAKKLSGGGGGLTPYYTTRAFTFVPKSSSPYNYVDLTEEERDLFVAATKSIAIAVFTVNNVEYRWLSVNLDVIASSDANSWYFLPERGATVLAPHILIIRFKAKTATYGLAATSAKIDNVALDEITVRFEFYSLESIL